MQKQIYGLIIWLIATLFVVYAFCLNTAAAVFIHAIQSSLHATNQEVGLAMAAFILGFACMQLPAGYLLDRYNSKYVISSGVLLLAIGNIAASYSPSLLLFSLANLLQGIGASFAFIAVGVLISQWFSANAFPILFGLTQTISCISAAISHYIFILALNTHPWQKLYFFLAVFGFILFALTLLLIKSPQKNIETKNETSLIQSLAIVGKNSQIWLCAIAAATSFGVLLAYAGFWYAPVQEFYSVENIQAVIISGMMFVGIGIGTPLLGWYSNFIQSRHLVLHLSLVIGTMFLLLALYLPHFNINSLAIIKISSFFTGFFLSGSMLFYTIVSEISSEQTRGVALSITNTCVFLFNSIMIFLPSFFITSGAFYYTYLWVLPFFILVSIFLIYFVKETFLKFPHPQRSQHV